MSVKYFFFTHKLFSSVFFPAYLNILIMPIRILYFREMSHKPFGAIPLDLGGLNPFKK